MDEKPFETLNVVPLVDVMLVLLTMVLTTANFIATGRIPVALPHAAQTRVEKQQDKAIEITANGDVYIDGQITPKEELEARFRALPPESSFLIRADRAVALQIFIDVADVLKRLNFTRVAVQTRSGGK